MHIINFVVILSQLPIFLKQKLGTGYIYLALDFFQEYHFFQKFSFDIPKLSLREIIRKREKMSLEKKKDSRLCKSFYSEALKEKENVEK